jgi:hypothetical protein
MKRLAFCFLSADQQPDHSTLAEFRKCHLITLAGLFMQAVELCEQAGLEKLGHIAIDSIPIKANASKHKAISCSMSLDGGRAGWRRLCKPRGHWSMRPGRKPSSSEREAEQKLSEQREKQEQAGKKAFGKAPKVPVPEEAKPKPKDQRNFTDSESRRMPDGANKGNFFEESNAHPEGTRAVDARAKLTSSRRCYPAEQG